MIRNNRLLANRYEIEKIAGKGGTSVVYKAYDLQAERAVRAIKEIRKSNIDVYDMAKLESALIKELYELDKTNAFFPNIIHRFETDNNFYIVQDYLDGESMEDMLKNGPMNEKMFLEAAKQICLFMEFFHNTGRVHSDMKPENIMVLKLGNSSMKDDEKIKLKFIDFGTAIKNSTGVTGYTPEYAAPEQYRNDPLDNRTDIFNIGATFYHIIQGRKPLKISNGKGMLTSQKRFRFDRKINPEIKHIIQKCVADEPSKRYHSCDDIYKELRRIERKTHLRLIVMSFAMAIICFIGAGAFAISANNKEVDTFNKLVKKEKYVEAIKYKNEHNLKNVNVYDLYFKFIESIKSDGKLDAEEDSFIINEIVFKDFINESDSGYGECMYKTAFAYWIYYVPYDDYKYELELEMPRNEKACDWFEKAVKSKDLKNNNKDEFERAKILFSACKFYLKIDSLELEDEDSKEVYEEIWNDVKELSSYIDAEREIISVRVCQTILSLISRNAEKFSENGVQKSEQEEILNKVYRKIYNEDYHKEEKAEGNESKKEAVDNKSSKETSYKNNFAIKIAEELDFSEVSDRIDDAYANEKEK